MPPERFIPALNRRWLTPLYDPILRLVMRERSFKARLVRDVHAAAGQRILDLGCGTGTLTVLLKQTYPRAEVCGVDIDPEVLARAGKKVAAAGIDVTLTRGSATELPYPSESFDHVVSSLMFHHLRTLQKEAAAREACRVLKPGGELNLFDFGPPTDVVGRAIAAVVKHLEETADNFAGRLPALLAAAGFEDVHEVDRRLSPFGPLVSYRARRPTASVGI